MVQLMPPAHNHFLLHKSQNGLLFLACPAVWQADAGCVLLLFLLFYASNCSVDEAGCIIFWGCPSISVHMCILRQRNSPAGNPGFFRKPNLVFLLVNGFYWFLCEVSYVTCRGWLKKLVVEFFCAGPRWVFRWRMETSILEYLKMPSNVLLMGFEL